MTLKNKWEIIQQLPDDKVYQFLIKMKNYEQWMVFKEFDLSSKKIQLLKEIQKNF
jgi:hypothetical protein